MKLKYQMRGLGIGIMVTALLMGVAMEKGIPLSDAEIKAKALELGMVERENLKLTDLQEESPLPTGASSAGEGDVIPDGSGTDGSGESDVDPEENDIDISSGANDPGSVPETDESLQAGSASESGTMTESGTAPGGNDPENGGSGVQDGGEIPSNGDESSRAKDAVTVTIEFGVTSAHVSELLEEAGLVEDAASFDAYLCSNGYSRKITAGVYEIQPGTSEEEIIEIITKNR